MQIAPPQIFSCFKITSTRLLALYNAVKKLPNPITLTAYTIHKSLLPQNRPRLIFSVHQIITSGGKFNIFSGQSTDKNTAHNSPKHATSSLKSQFSLGRGYTPPLPRPSYWCGEVPLPTPSRSTKQAFLILPLFPPKISAISTDQYKLYKCPVYLLQIFTIPIA